MVLRKKKLTDSSIDTRIVFSGTQRFYYLVVKTTFDDDKGDLKSNLRHRVDSRTLVIVKGHSRVP